MDVLAHIIKERAPVMTNIQLSACMSRCAKLVGQSRGDAQLTMEKLMNLSTTRLKTFDSRALAAAGERTSLSIFWLTWEVGRFGR